MSNAPIAIITPTTGKNGLKRLCDSLEAQSVDWVHILLWDDKREEGGMNPGSLVVTSRGIRYSIVVPGGFVQGGASGSALRAVGLMAANTPYVTFADDDVWYEPNHLESLLKAIQGRQWAYCRRKVWANENNYIGIDNFESVGDSPEKKVPYEMVDNNTMIFARRFGTSGAVLYRETIDYNDDRLMYAFLKKHAGEPGKIKEATVNQICPKRLEKMFREYCSK